MVARVARRLGLALATGALTRSELRWADLGEANLTGQQVVGVAGYGKHLLIRTDAGWTLHSHLRMDGYWRVHRTAQPPAPLRHRSIRAVLATARWTCAGHHLGMLNLTRTSAEGRLMGHLGPDLMIPEPDVELAARNARAHGQRAIGAVLLDQRVAAGIGTIYLAETLWRHQVSPWRPAAQVPELEEVYATASALMRRSAEAVEITATGDLGMRSFVHGREGGDCRRCQATIAVGEVGEPPYQRPAFYCPRCQPD